MGVECGVLDRSYVHFHGQTLIGQFQSTVIRYSNARETKDGGAGVGIFPFLSAFVLILGPTKVTGNSTHY